jgi:uncharacterized protein with PIN domain
MAIELDLFIYRDGVPRTGRSRTHSMATIRQQPDLSGLNYGDCVSYALAKTRGVSILFTENDFV